MNIKQYFNKIWTRNLVYVLFVICLFIISFIIIFENFLGEFSAEIIYFAGFNFPIFLIPAVVIDIIASDYYWYSIGIKFNRKTLFFFVIGIASGLLSIAIIAGAVSLIFNNSISIHFVLGYEYYTYGLSAVLGSIFWIFNDAATEELIFRGFIFQNLLKKYNDRIIVSISSLLFAICHFTFNSNLQCFNIILFINTFLAGVLFCQMYIKTKSMWLQIAFHFAWNFAMLKLFKIDTVEILTFNNAIFDLFIGTQSEIEAGIFCSIVLISLLFISKILERKK